MSHMPTPAGWVPLRQALVEGVRGAKQRSVAHPDLASLPEWWVSFEDYTLKGVRRKKPEVPITVIKAGLPKPPPEPLPEEAYHTLLEAYGEIASAPGADSPVFETIELVRQDSRDMAQEGAFSRSTQRLHEGRLNKIRENYAKETEAVTNWFLQEFFRVIEDYEIPELPFRR
ncbi:MAG: hypothetical protein HQL56_10945 [Magnetococcales bacterium]|nr:hypothetical protein [Magnetococcales bacterium]